ncbi:MAG: CHAD domain-containing protein [Chloroflexi bacterium]|nr:CHAD domain-containing protein [Chloroflexota bacterium]
MFSAASADLEPVDNRHQLVAVLAMTDDRAPPPALTRSSTMRELTGRILLRQWQALISQESGVREADDVDAVHDMRVATRRLRAALRLYEEVYPPRGQEVRQQLAELADALGAERDLDLQLAELRTWQADASDADRHAFDGLVAALAPQRAQARRALLDVFEGDHFETLAANVQRLLAESMEPDRPAAEQPLGEIVPRLVKRQHKKLRRQASEALETMEPAALHQTRIRGKRLRYAVEFVSEVYGRPADRFIRAMTEQQDVLGDHQDAQVGIHRLESLAEEPNAQLSPHQVFLAGRLAERLSDQAADLRERFPDVYRQVQKCWRDLDRAMARHH